MKDELGMQMSNMTRVLVDSIDQILMVQDSVDQSLAFLGDATESALLTHGSHGEFVVATHGRKDHFDPSARPKGDMSFATSQAVVKDLNTTITENVEKITAAADALVDTLEPALLLIGKWETTFGDKLQAGVEMFATAVDLVQKLFDQIMAQMKGGGGPDPYMEDNTYTLFAMTDTDKGISVQDLKDVSGIYSITALNGAKAEEMHAKYDINKDAYLDSEEYKAFVLDDSLPEIMAVVLRTYSSRLTQVAGSLRAARMRDEVANALVHYLQLVSAKNMTKVGWVADLLGNGTLPMEFTADVMKNLAMVADDPSVLTTADVGSVVIGTMSTLHPDYTTDAANLMADTDFWVSEGFDPADQPVCVDRVTQWMSASFLQTGAIVQLTNLHRSFGTYDVPAADLHELSGKSAKALGYMGRVLVEKNRATFNQRRHEALLTRYHELHKNAASRSLFNRLLGGQMASRADPSAASAVNSGVPAANVTLMFMSYLANNASDNAQLFQHASFDYSSKSSSAMDSFATKVQGLVKKFQAFLNLLDDYSGEEGVARLRAQVKGFGDSAASELTDAIGAYVTSGVVTSLKQTPGDSDTPAPPSSAEAWAMLATAMETMQSILPACIDSLKASRDESAMADAVLESVFSVFSNKGKDMFDDIAKQYKLAWTIYFVLFVMITLGILYYGLWAAGVVGDVAHSGTDRYCPEYERPTTCKERMGCCWQSCTHCLWHHSETDLCFWSMLLTGQLVVLLMFLVSVVLILLAGVNMFLATGCAKIYVLGDPKICSQNLLMILNFMNTFNPGESSDVPIADICDDEKLATCDILSNDMMMAGALTVVGAILAAVFTFALLVESAIAHERARNHRLMQKLLSADTDTWPEEF